VPQLEQRERQEQFHQEVTLVFLRMRVQKVLLYLEVLEVLLLEVLGVASLEL
jgi:hypothetical protein